MATNELRSRKPEISLNKASLTKNAEHSDNENKATHELKAFQEAFPSLKPLKNSYYLTRVVLVRFIAFIYSKSKLEHKNSNLYHY